MINKTLISIIVVLTLLSVINAEVLRDEYRNGIYFDQDGIAHTPFSLAAGDTAIFLFDTPSSANWPTGLAKQGTSLYWLGDSYSELSRLYLLSQTGGVVTSYSSPLNGFAGIEYDGQHIYAVYEHQFKLYQIDRSNGQVITQYDLPKPDTANPDRHAWGIAWDGEYFWHSQYGENSIIYQLEPESFAVVDSIVPSAEMILGLAYADPFLFGIDIRNRLIFRYDIENHVELDSYDWPVNYSLGLHYDEASGNFLCVSSTSEHGGDEAIYQVELSTDIEDSYVIVPSSITLPRAYPNPFNATTSIRYTLNTSQSVKVEIYNIMGQLVACLSDGFQQAGEHTLYWRADEKPSGIYFARFAGDDFEHSMKLTLLK